MSTFLPLLRYCDDEPEDAAPSSTDSPSPPLTGPADVLTEKQPAEPRQEPETAPGTPAGPVSILKKQASRREHQPCQNGDVLAGADSVTVSAGPGAPKRRVSFNLPTSVDRHGPAELPPPGNGYSWGTGAGSCPAPETVIISSDDWRDYLDPASWPREKPSSAHGGNRSIFRVGARDRKRRVPRDACQHIKVGNPADAVVLDARGYSTDRNASAGDRGPHANGLTGSSALNRPVAPNLSKWLKADASDAKASDGNGREGRGKKQGKKIKAKEKKGRDGKGDGQMEAVLDAGGFIMEVDAEAGDGEPAGGGEQHQREMRPGQECEALQGHHHQHKGHQRQQEGQRQGEEGHGHGHGHGQSQGKGKGQPQGQGQGSRRPAEAIVDVARRVYQLQMRWLEEECMSGQELELGTRIFTPAQFDDVSLERQLAGRCGYPGCGNAVAPPKAGLQPRYRISLKDKAVYDKTRAARYCRPKCAVLAAEYTRTLEAMPPQDMPAVFRRLDALLASQGGAFQGGVSQTRGDNSDGKGGGAPERGRACGATDMAGACEPSVGGVARVAATEGEKILCCEETTTERRQELSASQASTERLTLDGSQNGLAVNMQPSLAAAAFGSSAEVDLVVRERDTAAQTGALEVERGSIGTGWAPNAVEGYVPSFEARLASGNAAQQPAPPAPPPPRPGAAATRRPPAPLKSTELEGTGGVVTNHQHGIKSLGGGTSPGANPRPPPGDDGGAGRNGDGGDDGGAGGDGGGGDGDGRGGELGGESRKQRYRQQKKEQRRKHKSKQSARDVRDQRFKERCAQAAPGNGGVDFSSAQANPAHGGAWLAVTSTSQEPGDGTGQELRCMERCRRAVTSEGLSLAASSTSQEPFGGVTASDGTGSATASSLGEAADLCAPAAVVDDSGARLAGSCTGQAPGGGVGQGFHGGEKSGGTAEEGKNVGQGLQGAEKGHEETDEEGCRRAGGGNDGAGASPMGAANGSLATSHALGGATLGQVASGVGKEELRGARGRVVDASDMPVPMPELSPKLDPTTKPGAAILYLAKSYPEGQLDATTSAKPAPEGSTEASARATCPHPAGHSPEASSGNVPQPVGHPAGPMASGGLGLPRSACGVESAGGGVLPAGSGSNRAAANGPPPAVRSGHGEVVKGKGSLSNGVKHAGVNGAAGALREDLALLRDDDDVDDDDEDDDEDEVGAVMEEEDYEYESDEGLRPAMSRSEWQRRRHRGPSAVTLARCAWEAPPPRAFRAELSPFGLLWESLQEWTTPATRQLLGGTPLCELALGGEGPGAGNDDDIKDGVMTNGSNTRVGFADGSDKFGDLEQRRRVLGEGLARVLPWVMRSCQLAVPLQVVESDLSELLQTLSLSRTLPAFNTAHWRLLAVLFLDALSCAKRGALRALRAGTGGPSSRMAQVAAAANLDLDKYEVLLAALVD